MLSTLLPLALLQAAAPAAPLPALSLDQQAALRCSAAFALVAAGQERGNAAALAYPALEVRGKEFFVRSMAQVMDDTGMTREQVSQLVGQSAQELWDGNGIQDAMPACLLLLDASGV